MASRKRRWIPGSGPPTWTCRTCGKRSYASWSHARWDCRQMRNRYAERRRELPYWSKPCRAIHVGSLAKRRKDP